MADVPDVPVPDGFLVRRTVWRDADETDLAIGYAVESAEASALRPDEARQPFELYVRGARSLPAFVAETTWVATDEGGAPAAIAYCWYNRRPENPHLLWFAIEVLEAHRRKGLGTHLLSLIAEVSIAESRPVLLAHTWDVAPDGEGFVRHVGGTAGRVQRESVLDLTTLDRDIVARWLGEGPGRAPDYELSLYEGAYPVDDRGEMERLGRVQDAMNGAPTDALPIEDRRRDADELIAWDAANHAAGDVMWQMQVRKRGELEYAGFTNMFWSPWNPTVVRQGGTAVHVEHRGYALGKWLKAAMLDKVLRERPDARIIRTSNAYSNDAMLGINVALGFEVARSETDWTVPIDDVLAYLVAR